MREVIVLRRPKVSIGNLKIAKMADIRLFWVAERVQREVLSILGGNSGVSGHDSVASTPCWSIIDNF